MMVAISSISYCYLTIFIVSSVLILAPLLFATQQLQLISETGVLGESLRSSVTLKILEGINVGCGLPMIVEIILDKATGVKNIDIANRSVFQFVSTLTGLLYLCLYDKYYMAYLYISCFSIRFLAAASIFLHAVSQGIISTKWKISPIAFIAPCFCIGVTNLLLSAILLSGENIFLFIFLMIMAYTAMISFIGVAVYWNFYFWRNYHLTNSMGHKETKELVYMIGLIVFVIALQLINAVYKWSFDWVNSTADIFVAYLVVIISGAIILNVLPGRLLRKMSEVTI